MSECMIFYGPILPEINYSILYCKFAKFVGFRELLDKDGDICDGMEPD